MPQFQFLDSEWRGIAESAIKAEQAAIPDPRTACFYARRALELAVAWAYKYDRALKLPYNENVSALIHEPTFKQTAGDAVFNKAINMIINQLVDHGIVDVSILYESPFTDVSPQGPNAIFTAEQIDKIMRLLDDIRSTAIAA